MQCFLVEVVTFTVFRLADHAYLRLWSNAKKLSSKQLFFRKITFSFISPTQTTHTHTVQCAAHLLLWYIGHLREHGYYRESPRQFLNSLPSFAESPIDDAKASMLCVDKGGKGKDSLVCQTFFDRSFGVLFLQVCLLGR